MQKITVSQVRHQLNSIIEKVEKGEEFEVTQGRRTVFVISSGAKKNPKTKVIKQFIDPKYNYTENISNPYDYTPRVLSAVDVEPSIKLGLSSKYNFPEQN